MALVDDLIADATNKIAAQEAGIVNRRAEVKEMLRDLSLLHPNGLKIMVRNSQWLEEFAVLIKGKEAELLPYVTTYGAALGMLGVWLGIMSVWVQTPWPKDQNIPQSHRDAGQATVTDFLGKSIRAYTRMIVK